MDRRSPLGTIVLIASLIAGISYMASWGLGLPAAASTVWKGAGVALLALYAAVRAQGAGGWMLCAVLAFGALGDILLETHGLTVGAVAFLVGHLIAIALYLRYRRPNLPKGDAAFAALLVPASVAIAFLLPADRAMAPSVALYTAGLALMAACAWISRFPRSMTGLGALMFVVSDLLIFARAGALAGQAWVGFGVWTLYYFGQALICLGGVRGLSRERRL
ncbi:lysoplasmalogenase [Phenylobacterium sp.]|uniref:lysoplasmalogenase n=1 Tax=Phenylobacterium sp. TaxID=1871053 RepID=UPI0035B1DD08